MNILDKLIEYVSPEAGKRRTMARMQIELARSYEGASIGRRTSGWNAGSRSQNAESKGKLNTLRNRARDLVRNVPYATAGIRGICNNVVGYGIGVRFKAVNGNAKYQKRYQELWDSWANTTKCDADGRCTFSGLQDLAVRTVIESGEVLIRRRIRRANDPLQLPVPMQLQVLEPDFIDETKDGLNSDNGNTMIQGKEYDSRGRCIAYWLFTQHPGDYNYQANLRNESIRVPAEEICHMYRIDRPGQVRGVTWFAPVMIRIKDFDEYEDAQLMRQKVAACFSVFVHDAEAPQSGINVTKPNELPPERVTPGMIEILPPGKDVKFAAPPGVDGYGEYTRISLHMIATGLGVPYSLITGDQSQTNFASGRMGWLDFNRSVEAWRWNMLIPQLMESTRTWFVDAAKLVGYMEPVTVTYSEPPREMINPKEEIAARREKIRSGYPWSRAMADDGYDPDQLIAEIAADNAKFDAAGVILDTDARKIALTGNAHTATPGETQNKPESNG